MVGLSAYAKGVLLGILEPRPELVREQGDRLAEGERLYVDLTPSDQHVEGCRRGHERLVGATLEKAEFDKVRGGK